MKAVWAMTAAFGVGATAPAWAGGGSSSSGAEAPTYPLLCSSSTDCPEGTTCSDGWCQSATDVWVPECQADADCASGGYCVDGKCNTEVCKSDMDCGPYTICELWSWPSSSGYPNEPPHAEKVPGEPAVQYGICVIDVEAVPAASSCAKLCAVVAACVEAYQTGSGPATPTEPPPVTPPPGLPACEPFDSTDADAPAPEPTEDVAVSTFDPAAFQTVCTAACSYGVLAFASADEVEAALSCAVAQPSCDAIWNACGDTNDYGTLLHGPVPVEASWGDAAGGSATSAGTSYPEEEPVAVPGTQTAGLTQDAGLAGCSGGRQGASGALFMVLALVVLALVRRRERHSTSH